MWKKVYPPSFIIRNGNLVFFCVNSILFDTLYVESLDQFQLFMAGVAEVVLSGFLPHVVERCVTVVRNDCRTPETDSLTPVMKIACLEKPKQIILLYSLKI